MEKRAHLFQLQQRTRRMFRRKYCMHYDAPTGCGRNIVEAHSVQRSMLAAHLAKSGHVLQFQATPQPETFDVKYLLKPIGINEATTFFGFCGKHDNDLFRPLETTRFDFTREQIALLGYRSICRELYLKDSAIASNRVLIHYARKHPEIHDAHKDALLQMQYTYHQNARRNLVEVQNRFVSILGSPDKSELRFYAVKFSSAPVYFSSTAFLPEWDFDGNALQNLSQLDPFACISFSAWASEGKSAIVFCWHAHADPVCQPFIDSLRRSKERRLENRILSMAFEMSETVVFKDRWWRSLSKRDRNLIHARVPSGSGRHERTRFSLLDHGLNALKSQVDCVHSSRDGETSYRRNTTE